MQNLTIPASSVPEILLRASVFKVGHMTLTMQNLTIQFQPTDVCREIVPKLRPVSSDHQDVTGGILFQVLYY